MKFIFVLSVLIFFSCEKKVTNTFKSDEISKILKHFEEKKVSDFDSFIDEVNETTNDEAIKTTIALYKNKSELKDKAQINFFRLISLYSRFKHRDEILVLLEEMVSIPTDMIEGTAQHENPNIIAFGKLIEKTAKSFGLEFRNIDNRIFEVTLPGKTEEAFGIYTHSDVVPADKSKWVLEDGTQLDPYKMQIIGDKIYGRGTEDDKCSIAASMLAMRLLKDINQVPNRTIRLIIETTEETSQEGFEYYKERNKLPDYNIVLDSSYPIVTAEKGFGILTTKFKQFKGKKGKHEILNVSGGLAVNQIPSLSKAKIRTRAASTLIKKLEEIKPAFHKEYGDNFSISHKKIKGGLELVVKGVSAHSSEPSKGVNPVPRMYLLLGELNKNKSFTVNHFTNAIRYVQDKIATDIYAKKFGVDYSDDFMGPLTSSLTVSKLVAKEKALVLAVNFRNPRGKETEKLKSELMDVMTKYKKEAKMKFEFDLTIKPFMYRNPQGMWIATLLNIYEEHTGNEGKPISSGGGTTAKQLPEAVSFGPSHPGEKYRGHNSNEYKTIKNLNLDVQMFTEMLLRIGTLAQMK